MTIRKEFMALIQNDKDLFKKEMFSVIEDRLSVVFGQKFIEESEKLLENTICKPKQKQPQVEMQEETKPVYVPIFELNNAIVTNRTNWIVTKDGSQVEVTPKMAKYLAELYKSLNNTHKDKLVSLILESEHGFRKALKTAEKLYGANNGHK